MCPFSRSLKKTERGTEPSKECSSENHIIFGLLTQLDLSKNSALPFLIALNITHVIVKIWSYSCKYITALIMIQKCHLIC